jgi:hypothetical protein
MGEHDPRREHGLELLRAELGRLLAEVGRVAAGGDAVTPRGWRAGRRSRGRAAPDAASGQPAFGPPAGTDAPPRG